MNLHSIHKNSLPTMTLIFVGAMIILSACSKGSSNSSKNSINSTGSATPAMMVANTAMANKLTFTNPNSGGMVGKLYIEPRNLMLAPDTAVVGCDQRGSGVLGMDAFLSQPTWITQDVVFTELFVPTQNFTLGFPYALDAGGVLAVDSYFAISATGYFHLSPTDEEGDYQFSLIADDGAQLFAGNPASPYSGNFSLIVDDEKPAGPNKGCLEQTQPAHMSCTNNWSDQAPTSTIMVHIAPGDIVPLKLNYWQGPGQGLAMMAFYRRVSDITNPASLGDTSCGKELPFSAGSSSLNAVTATWTPISFSNLTSTAD